MQAVHETGHVLGAWLTGGRVERVILHPFTISRTDLSENPDPLLVTWAGPLFGVAAPILAWALAALLRMPGAFVLRFFAGFCLLTNGLYIGVGSFGGIGDCGELLRNGAPIWQLWLFGGLWLRRGCGCGTNKGRISGWGRPTGKFIVELLTPRW